jgi:hypothetical protein
MGSECLLPLLQIMLDEYRKVDPPTWKKLPVQADDPELLVKMVHQARTPQCQKATPHLIGITFYYHLRVGEYAARAQKTIQSKPCSSSMRMLASSQRMARANRDASHVMPPTNSLSQLTA